MRSLAILLTGAAAISFGAGAALADETTVIHEQRQVIGPQAPNTVEQRTTTQTDQDAVGATTTVRRHVVLRHRVVHHVVHHTMAAAAPAHAADTSAVFQDTQAQTGPAATDQSASVVDKRTVIHHDSDTGQTDTHTRIIRQDENGVTTVDHRSTEQTTTP
jgi:hypothetical protein